LGKSSSANSNEEVVEIFLEEKEPELYNRSSGNESSQQAGVSWKNLPVQIASKMLSKYSSKKNPGLRTEKWTQREAQAG
jgi:hypothetical protein